MSKLYLIFLYCLLLGTQCAQQIMPLTPKIIVSVTQKSYNLLDYNLLYFSVSVPESTAFQMLLITLMPSYSINTVIYTSHNQLIERPTKNNNTGRCSSNNINICPIKLQSNNRPTILYFSVQVSFDLDYQIEVEFDSFYPLRNSQKYSMNFSRFQSFPASLTSQQFSSPKHSNILIIEYKNPNPFNNFSVEAALDEVYNQQAIIYGQDLGAHRKMLKLPAPSNQNSTYYIFIFGMNESFVLLNLIDGNNKLSVNNVYYDVAYEDSTYTMSSSFFSEPISSLMINLSSYTGYGIFNFDYCDGLINFTHQNVDGANGRIYIKLSERKLCYSKNHSINTENIIVNITNVMWKFGFSIDIRSTNEQVQISTNEKYYGFSLSNITSYQINTNSKKQINIKCQNITGSISFVLIFCSKSICTTQGLTNGADNIFKIQQNTNYLIQTYLKTPFSASTYSIHILEYPISQTIIQVNKNYTQTININQYQYYIINTVSIGPPISTILSLYLTNLNGQAEMLTSLTQERPTFDMLSDYGSDVIYSVRGSVDYEINSSTKAVYIAIVGAVQSFYNIKATVNPNADIAARYNELVEPDRKFVMTDKQGIIYIAYKSHTIPFRININPIPQCISYGTYLPLSKTCEKLPGQFYSETVYIQIKDSKVSSFTGSVSVNKYSLIPQSPLFISCRRQCFQIVNVAFSQKQISIAHRGEGSIQLIGFQETISNGILTVSCVSPPCNHQINASIAYIGQMHIAYQNDIGQQIQWRTKPIQWSADLKDSYQGLTPKYFYFRVPKYSSKDSFNLFSGGMTPSIYYNIYIISDNITNTIPYKYPNHLNYTHIHPTHPSTKLHIVEVDEKSLRELGCYQSNAYCLVTVSVYINKTIEFDNNYVRNGIGYYSANTYDFYIPLDYPYKMEQSYSLSYFHALLDNVSQKARINIVDLTDCRPQIIIGDNQGVRTDTIITTTNNSVSFGISATSNCIYYVTLSTSSLLTMVPNILYHLQMTNSSETERSTVFIFSRTYWKPLTIQVKNSNICCILIKKVVNNVVIVPSLQDHDLMVNNTSILQLIDNQTGLYAVRITSANDQSISVIAHIKGFPIQMIHNQQQIQVFKEVSQSMSYNYETFNQYWIQAKVNTGSIKLTVIKNSDQVIVQQIITQTSDPKIKVPFYPSNKIYSIRAECLSLGKSNEQVLLSIYPVQMNPSQVYEGIMSIDSLLYHQSTNCYMYETPLIIGRKTISIDFTYLNKTIDINSVTPRFSIPEHLVISTVLISPNTLRIQTSFIPKTKFNFCVTLNDVRLAGQEYYLLIESGEIDHLAPAETIINIESPNYHIFKVVNPKSEPMTRLVQLTNCIGRTDLYVSSSFQDVKTGMVSQSHDYWSDSDSVFSLTNLQEGYAYLGLKSQSHSAFEMKSISVPSNTSLYMKNWVLAQKSITQLSKDQDSLIIKLPKLIFKGTKPEFCHIQYTVFIHQLKMNSKFNTATLPKCPTLFNTSTYQTYNQNIHQFNQTPTFKIPLQDLPQQFNATALAELYIPGYPFTAKYYYSTAFVPKQETNLWKYIASILKPLFLIIGISILIGAIGLCIVMLRRWSLRRSQNRVAFEMSPFNAEITVEATVSQRTEPEKTESVTVQQKQNEQPSKRKALNENVGYGEFVDESQ